MAGLEPVAHVPLKRREWDSNPRSGGHPDSCFQDKCIRPLCHLSKIADLRISTEAQSLCRKNGAPAESPIRAGAGYPIRLGPESNRRSRFCRPLHNHSATESGRKGGTTNPQEREHIGMSNNPLSLYVADKQRRSQCLH